MARPSSSDTRFLEQKNGKWRVTVSVPRALQTKLGTKLKRPLNTDSLAIANRLKWQAVSELKTMIQGAEQGGDTLTREAVELAAYRLRAASEDEVEELDAAIMDRGDEIRGDPIDTEHGERGEGPVYVYDPERSKRAGEYVRLAKGEATPLLLHHGEFIGQSQNKARTKADDERAVKYLAAWCERNRVSTTLQAISRRVATRFMDGFAEVAPGLSPVTLNKYLVRLSVYWQWLERREHVEVNVWAGLHLKKPSVAEGETERAFTDKEVAKLLSGPASPAMHHLMHIAALKGARLDAIVDLKVKGCADGLFTFKRQKKEASARSVPIHPDLTAIVESRTVGRAPDDDLFPEWPGPQKAGSLRERSFKASNAFTKYRREVDVDEVVPGKRRALVNFHSFRRWFITKAERADQPESIIAVVVGHKRQGMTLGRYSAGPLMEQARRCVEAVRLPQAGRA